MVHWTVGIAMIVLRNRYSFPAGVEEAAISLASQFKTKEEQIDAITLVFESQAKPLKANLKLNRQWLA